MLSRDVSDPLPSLAPQPPPGAALSTTEPTGVPSCSSAGGATHESQGTSSGVNIAPGSEDDGWIVPEPVTLDDGTQLQLYKDGEALHAAYSAILSAKRQICLEVYIFAGDETGTRFAEALLHKARHGCRVYLIYDAFGSGQTSELLFRDLRRAGVRMQKFHPIKPWQCNYSWRPLNRDHRKLLVIDDEIAGLGGLNVGAEYAGSWIVQTKSARNSPACDFWRDNAIGLRGPAVRVLKQCFARTWRYCAEGGRIKRALTLDPPAPDPRTFTVPTTGSHFSLMASVPTLDSPLRPWLQRLFGAARSSIRMTMAYFAPDDDLIDSLCRAARRGVRVQLMLPGKCDVPLFVTAARSYYDTLIQAGVDIYERQGVVLHAKTMVVDEHISVIGSTNLDYRSIEYNLEMSGIITSRALGRQMATLFQNDVRYARKIDPATWRRRPNWDRLVQWTVGRGRYLM